MHSLIIILHQLISVHQLLEELAEAKIANKKRLAAYVKHHLNIDVDVNTLFDVQECPRLQIGFVL